MLRLQGRRAWMCGATRYVGGGIWRLGKWWVRAGDGMVLHLCSRTGGFCHPPCALRPGDGTPRRATSRWLQPNVAPAHPGGPPRWRARSIAGTAKQQTRLPFSAASEASPAPQAAAGTPHPLASLPARFAPALPPRPAPSTSLCRPGEYPPLFSTLFAPSSNLSSSASRAYLNPSDNIVSP